MDRDKVIKGLELCLGSIDSAGCPEECPYYEACQKYENYAVFQPLMRDALEALKAQEPRVMTLEEIEDALDTVVWVEEPQVENLADRYGLLEAYSHKAGFVDIFFGFSDPPVTDRYYYSDYGKTWRCWAYRPTDEQRKAVKWDADAAD